MRLNPQSEPARDSLRRGHGVRLVRPEEEGFAAASLAPGVYGFTGSPALASPLFAIPRYRNFEVHRTAHGETVLIGFVTIAEANRLTSSTDAVHITAYPDIDGDSSTIVAIPYDGIVHHRQYSIRNSVGIALEVRPLGQSTGV